MYKPYETSFRNQSMTIREKLYNISFSYVMFIVILAAIGILAAAFAPAAAFYLMWAGIALLFILAVYYTIHLM